MNVGTQAALAVVVGVGMTRVTRGTMSMAELTAFVMYLFYMVSPLVLFFLAIGQFQQGRAAIRRVDELTVLPQEGGVLDRMRHRSRPAAKATDPSSLSTDKEAVEFRSANFRYAKDDETAETLSEVSFTVASRGMTAIVGPSGAGKTTLFQLIERFCVVGLRQHPGRRQGHRDDAAGHAARTRRLRAAGHRRDARHHPGQRGLRPAGRRRGRPSAK